MADQIKSSDIVRPNMENNLEINGKENDSNACSEQSEASKPPKEPEPEKDVKKTCNLLKPSFLRPSALSAHSDHPKTQGVPLKSPQLNLDSCKFASPDTIPDSIFNSYFNIDKDKDSKKQYPTSTSSDGSNSSTTNNSKNSLSNPNFVFGQNLHERVTSAVGSTTGEPTASASTANGTVVTQSEMLFTSLTKGQSATRDESQKTLLEDAARCEEARAPKRKYEEVQVSTGEEDESNVLQMNVKLFAFENGSWVERGRGNLRLNDHVISRDAEESTESSSGSNSSSRIVVRTMGSLRVVLNTKIWAGMDLSRASEKSLRLTAVDAAGQPKIFLIQASPSDITSLYQSIESRVRRCKSEELREKRLKSDEEAGDDKEKQC